MQTIGGIHAAFDLLAWAGAATGGYLAYRWRLASGYRRIAERLDARYFIALVGGSLLGSYGLGTLNLHLSDVPGVGRSILGAIVGGTLAIELYKIRRGISGSTGIVFAVPLLVAIGIGRWGCFFAGIDDHTHGIPTALSIGHDFGDGIPRHPVQLYESATMLAALAIVLWQLRRRSAFVLRNGFYLVVGWYGLQRFALEFLKPYAAIAGPLNLFHLLSAVLVAYSAWMLLRSTRHAVT